MRKCRDGEKRGKKNGKKKKKEKTDENSGHYVIASSRPPERRTLAPISVLIAVTGTLALLGGKPFSIWP